MIDFVIRASATLVGALAAFGLAWVRLRYDMRSDRIEKLKTAIFVLILQREFLRNLWSQILAPAKKHPLGGFAIPPILAAPPNDSMSITPLSYLLANGEAETVSYLMLADAKFRSVVTLIEARNSAHYAFQERLAASPHGVPGATGTLEDVRNIAGLALTQQIEQLSGDLDANSDDAINFNREAIERAFACFKRQFPCVPRFEVEDIPLTVSPPHAK